MFNQFAQQRLPVALVPRREGVAMLADVRRHELIAATHSLKEICKYVTADTLGYLSVEGMLSVIPDAYTGFCTACFDGNYPVEFPWAAAEQPGLFDR